MTPRQWLRGVMASLTNQKGTDRMKLLATLLRHRGVVKGITFTIQILFR